MQDVMTPEDYELLLSLGGENAQLAEEMKMQMLQAEQLRKETPEGRMISGHYVAPSITQFASKMMGDKWAHDKQTAALETSRTAGRNTTQQNQMIMQGILRGNKPLNPSVGGTATPPFQQAPMQEDPYARFRKAGGLSA